MKHILSIAVLALAASVACFGQAKAAAAATPAAQSSPPIRTGPGPSSGPNGVPPQLTETERLTVENLQLKATVIVQQQRELTQQQQQNQQRYDATMAAINKEHPGWIYNPQSQTFQALPAPQPAAKK